MNCGDGNILDLPSVLYPSAQLELNLVLHVCNTSRAPEISMHGLKNKQNKPQTTAHFPSYCQQIILLLGSALLNLIMFCWLQLCDVCSFKAGQESVCLPNFPVLSRNSLIGLDDVTHIIYILFQADFLLALFLLT